MSARLMMNFYVFCYTYSRGINSIFRKLYVSILGVGRAVGIGLGGAGCERVKGVFVLPFTWEN